MLNYLKGFVHQFKLNQYIHFKTWVQHVRFDKGSEKFIVTVKDLQTSKEREEDPFDYVIVATGHFNYPNYVRYPGQETFKGKVIHSKQFLEARRYKGSRFRFE